MSTQGPSRGANCAPAGGSERSERGGFSMSTAGEAKARSARRHATKRGRHDIGSVPKQTKEAEA